MPTVRGASVVIVDVNELRAKQLAVEVGGDVLAIGCDVGDPEGSQIAVDAATNWFGRLLTGRTKRQRKVT